jgi:hypothetical protein
MFDFKTLAKLTAVEEAFLTRKEAPTSTAHGIGVGVDASEFETPPIDAAATARAIVKAAKSRDGGGAMMPKPSTVAQQILDAGAKRRGEG